MVSSKDLENLRKPLRPYSYTFLKNRYLYYHIYKLCVSRNKTLLHIKDLCSHYEFDFKHLIKYFKIFTNENVFNIMKKYNKNNEIKFIISLDNYNIINTNNFYY